MKMATVFPKRLRAERERAGFSQADLAQKSNLSQGHVAQLEQGRKTPSLDTVDRLAEALGVEGPTLLGA